MSRQKTKKLSKKKKGGVNTSPRSRAARTIQSRFRAARRRAVSRAARSRALTEQKELIKKQLETLDPYLKQKILDMIGRGKKKKSKKLTNKKRKSRSKRGG